MSTILTFPAPPLSPRLTEVLDTLSERIASSSGPCPRCDAQLPEALDCPRCHGTGVEPGSPPPGTMPPEP